MAAISATSSATLLLGVAATTTASHHRHLRHHNHLIPHPKPLTTTPFSPLKLIVKPSKPTFLCFSSQTPTFPHPNPSPQQNPLPNFPNFSSTLTLATLFSLSVSLTSKLAQLITNSLTKLKSLAQSPTPQELQSIQFIHDNLLCTVGPLFFAAARHTTQTYTPLTVVAKGMSKWLDIYSGVLLVRVLLSWFPNIPWDRQPLSAIRDLCDPYLSLFRNIIPPVFDTLDVSPLLAFAVLGTLGSILNSSTGISG